jgi:ADP-heptose:LPS heptosyltransferase
LDEALSLIDKTDLLITCDSGPLHYAATRGVWTIAFVAARYPLAIWYPFSDHVAVISNMLIECRQKNCSRCSLGQNLCVNGDSLLREFSEFFNREGIQSYLPYKSVSEFSIQRR